MPCAVTIAGDAIPCVPPVGYVTPVVRSRSRGSQTQNLAPSVLRLLMLSLLSKHRIRRTKMSWSTRFAAITTGGVCGDHTRILSPYEDNVYGINDYPSEERPLVELVDGKQVIFVGDLLIFDAESEQPRMVSGQFGMQVSQEDGELFEGSFDLTHGHPSGWVRTQSSDGTFAHCQYRALDGVRDGEYYEYVPPQNADDDDVNPQHGNDVVNPLKYRQWKVSHGYFRDDLLAGPNELVMYESNLQCIISMCGTMASYNLEGEVVIHMVDPITGNHMPNFPTLLGNYHVGLTNGFASRRRYNSQRQMFQRYDGYCSQGRSDGLGRLYHVDDNQTVRIKEAWWREGDLDGMCLETDVDRCESSLTVRKLEGDYIHCTHRVVLRDHCCLPSCEGVPPVTTPLDVTCTTPNTLATSPTSADSLLDPHSLSLPHHFAWLDVSQALKLCASLSLCSAVATDCCDSILNPLWVCESCSVRTGKRIPVCRACRDTCHSECSTGATFAEVEDNDGYCHCPFLWIHDRTEFHCRCQSEAVRQQSVTNSALYQLRVAHSIPLSDICDDDIAIRAASTRARLVDAFVNEDET